MAHLSLAVWALPLTGPAVPLPDLRTWKVSPTDGDWGSVELVYPANGRGVDLLYALAEQDVDLKVEVVVRALDGRVWRKPALLLQSSVDDVAETGEITVTGHFHEYELGEVVVPYAPGQPNGETAVSGTAGQIVGPLLTAAQGRGCLAGVTWTFTDTLDSTGAPWTHTGTLKFSPGQTYAAMLGTLAGYGLSEWELTSSRELRLYDGEDGKGVDRTIGSTSLTLERGRDLGDAPRRHSLLGAATALVAAGKDGIYSLFSDTTAQARRGRRIEQYASFGNTADQGTLDALTSARLATMTAGALELSHKLVLGAGHPTPLLDFVPSDWVYSATRAGVARRRVRQVTLAGAADKVTEADVTVGAVIDEWAVRQQRRIDDLASGAAVVGTSTPQPDVDDGATPAAPTGLVANSLWYATGEGIGLAQITAAWTATAGTTASPVAGYVVEWHYVDAALGAQWQQLAQTDALTLTWSGVNPGAGVEVRVSAVNKWGRSSAPSAPYALTTQVNTTPPPVLPAPAGSAYLGLLKWDWGGKGAAGEVMPANFLHAELHLSTTSGFTPHRPLLADGRSLDTVASTTYRDRLTGAGELPVDPGGAYGTTWYAKWVAVDRSRNASAASAQGSAVRTQAADGDIAAVNIGKLTTGILSALLTISGIIRTATAGARVEIDTAGLRCIAASGAILFEFNIPTSILTLVGKLIAGPGVGVGATIVIDPGPPPRVLLYPSGTQQRYSMSAQSTVRPDGSTAAGLQLAALNTSGQTDGFNIDAWATNVWIGHKNTSGTFTGGVVKLEQLGAAVIGTDNGFVQINADGTVTLNAPASKSIDSNIPMGTTGAGFSQKLQSGATAGVRGVWNGADGTMRFADNQAGGNWMKLGDGNGAYKNFVIPHPVDPDRWLVHACIEAPEAQVEYRGTAVIVDGRADVDLPAYFPAATVPGSATVHVTMQLPDGTPGEVQPAAASSPDGAGRFHIVSPAPDGTQFVWLVKATRADGPPLVAEPLRTDVEIGGVGPYTYVVDPGEAA